MIPPLVPINIFFDILATLDPPQQKIALENRLHQIESKKISLENDLSQKMKRSKFHVNIPKVETDTYNTDSPRLKRALKVIKNEFEILSKKLFSLKERDREEVNSLKTAERILDSYIHSKDPVLLNDFFSKAIKIQNPKAVKNLIQAQPKFNINDPDAFDEMSPLTLAVLNKDESMVRFLVTLGADLNEPDADEMTPLTLAVLQNDKQMVTLLHSLGANLNASDARGLTPLILAVLDTDESMVRLLIEKLNANKDGLSTDGYTALSTALTTLNKPMFQLLNELGADLTEAENLIQLHMVSTFFGLEGKATHVDHVGKKWTISIDGFETEMTIYALYHSVTNFLDRRQSSLKKSIRNSIVETIELATKISGWTKTSVESKDLVDRIQTGSPTLIPTGWHGHAISLVFGNEKLFVCNRGDGFSGHAIQAYACPYASVTEELISKLRENNSSKEEFLDFLKQPPLNNQPLVEEEMDMEELKVDNCSWGNTKAGFLALLNVITEKTIPDIKRRHKWCYNFYKHYTTQFRIQIAKEYLDQPLNLLSPEILDKLLNKITEHKHIPIKIKQTLIRKIQKIALGG